MPAHAAAGDHAEEVDFVLNALDDSMKELSKEAGLGKND